MTLLTIFTAPKAFTNAHIAMIQRNAIRSWLALGNEVEVLLIGQEEGLGEAAMELGARWLPQVERNSYGTPLIRSIFEVARENGRGELLAYVNADILLMPDFIESARAAAQQASRFLLVGQRWDLDVREPLDFSPEWDNCLHQMIIERGRLHPAGGSDYFIFPRNCFEQLPDMAVGRAGWDNWMIYAGRRQGYVVIDASESIRIVHQDHDYSHLPNGQPHYHLPETDENVRLGGGKLTIFRLEDASHRMKDSKISRLPITWKRFWREAEIFPLVTLHSKWLAWLFFAVFHPYKAYVEWRRARSGGR